MLGLENLILMQVGGFFGGGSIGNMLNYWAELGFFTYLLPFLLIFSVIFAILAKINVFGEHKGINGIIAVVVGLMSLQFGMVAQFFEQIFPRLAVGIMVILVLLILVGMFAPAKEAWFGYTIFGISVLILVIILVQTSGAIGWGAGLWWYANWREIAMIIIFVIVIAIIVGSSKEGSSQLETPLAKALLGENAFKGK